jgi:uncharacterized protein with PIN domain
MMSPPEIRFIADVMLGRLSKWLRVIGYDTVYRSVYREGEIHDYMGEGRVLLSRNRRLVERYNYSLLIESDHAGTQIRETVKKGYLLLNKSQWFSRCLVCNVPFQNVSREEAQTHIPEYIFSQNISALHLCPSCGRYFWPGSHKARMVSQISEWFSEDA